MASNLSTIGFVFEDEDDFQAMMTALAESADGRLPARVGDYVVWRSRTGAELWFHAAPPSAGPNGPDAVPEREIHGLTPFFEGRSEVRVKLTTRSHRDGDNAFEGMFVGWVNPDETGEGSYPLSFDAVDFAAHESLELPAVRTVRIAGFARELRAFGSLAAYEASRGSDAVPLAGQCFVPIGLFADAAEADGDSDRGAGTAAATPSSSALLTGRVVEHTRLTNERTGRAFHWLVVESLDATYDIVADPSVIVGEIRTGGTVEAVCWMFGRLIEEE